MTGTEPTADQKLLTELRDIVKALPLNERKQGAVLYSIFEQILENKAQEEKLNEAAFQEYSSAINKITGSMDEIIEGKRKVTDEEIAYWRDNVDSGYVAAPEHNTEAPIKGFWRKFIENSGIYHGVQDGPILEHLTHVEISDETDKEDPTISSMILTLDFSPNEFFKNAQLKTKLVSKSGENQKSEGTAIEWTNNPTIKKTTKTQKNKRSGQTRTITKETQLKSFFEIFGNYSAEDADDKDDGKDDEEAATMNIWELSQTLDQVNDYIPYALEYYLGVVDEDDDDGDEGDDDEDEEDDQGEDSDDDARKHKLRKAGKGEAKTNSKKDSKKASRKQSEAEKQKDDKPKEGTTDPKNPECKQQ
jgi:hypothetical protein